MLDATGKFVFSIFMALSQFIEPYSAKEIAKFNQKKELKSWEKEAYAFKPLSPQELTFLWNDNENKSKFAIYLRSACVRMISSIQNEKTLKKGSLLNFEGIELLLDAVEKGGMLTKLQKRLIKEEQNISLGKVGEYVRVICDVRKPLQELLKKDLFSALEYYVDQYDNVYLDKNKNSIELASQKDLPKLSEVSVIKDSQGKAIGEYAKTEVDKKSGQVLRRNRRRLSVKSVPIILKKALVAIEDDSFWNFETKASGKYKGHKGVYFRGMLRAFQVTGSGDGVQGASTITMQLAKNLILYKDVFNEAQEGKRSLLRKLKEYILVEKLEKLLTKDEILNLYLDTIDFGRNSQGIVMAAQSYFGKTPDKLSLGEVAFLAGLPKAPNSLDPRKNYEKAKKRRNRVLRKLKKEKFISKAQYKAEKDKEIKHVRPSEESFQKGYAAHYINAVESELEKWMTQKSMFKGTGLDIEIPINHEYQKWAVEALQRGLLNFERKTKTLTVKPSEDRLPNIKEAVSTLAKAQKKKMMQVYPEVLAGVSNKYPDGGQFKLGVILSDTRIGLDDGTQVNRQSTDLSPRLKKEVGRKRVNLSVWDVVLLQEIKKGEVYKIASFTKVQGGVVVLDNKTGEVLATAGGFSVGVGKRYKGAKGNRAFVAKRQPGSTVKPFTYLYALGKRVNSSEIVLNKNISFPIRKDANNKRICGRWSLYGGNQWEKLQYPLRSGLEFSINRLTANAFLTASERSGYSGTYPQRLGQGIDEVLGLMQSYGLYQDHKYACYPIMLGAKETTVKDMAAAYGTIARGGMYKPAVVIKAVKHRGKSLRYETQGIKSAKVALSDGGLYNLNTVKTMLQGVVKKGTAKKIKRWSHLIAGKTGTTNDYKDAWFVGFNKDITVAVWVGNPNNKPLSHAGYKAEGGKVALPIFEDFMESYYKSYPEKLREPLFDDGAIQEPVWVSYKAVVQPDTGFYLSDEFKADYEKFTGHPSDTLYAVEKDYNEEEGRLIPPRPYDRSSRVAGEFFFKSLTSQRKRSEAMEYLNYRKGLIQIINNINAVGLNAELERASGACDDGVTYGFAHEPEIKADCHFVEKKKKPNLSQVNPMNFYLEKYNFLNN